jgi:parvulin-like peptidyl-prolyl isomerase
MYRAAMHLTDADIARFLASHEADVKKKYADEERTYKATKPALKLRSIFIAATTLPIDQAKAKLEAARTAITANKQTFADAAKELASDAAAKANGGDVGWRSVENAQLGDKAINDAVKTLAPGEMTPVIATDAGVYLVKAEDKREGDLSYDQVKNEIAAELARDVWSKEKAKRAALEALDAARAGTGKNLEQLFPKTTEDKIKEQIEKQGSIMPVQKDVLAEWKAEDGSAGSASPEIAASSEVLPAFGDVQKPHVATFGPMPRMKELPGIGDNKDAIAAVFDELSVGMVAKPVYEHDGTFFIVQLKDKQAANLTDFDKVAEQQVDQLREVRGHFLVESWLKDKCEALAKEDKIKPMRDLVRETDDAGKPLPQEYRPCRSFR